MSIWAYWGELEFGWTPTISGLTVSFYGVLMGVAQASADGQGASPRFGAGQTRPATVLMLGIPPPTCCWPLPPVPPDGDRRDHRRRADRHDVPCDAKGPDDGAGERKTRRANCRAQLPATVSLTFDHRPGDDDADLRPLRRRHWLFFPGAPYLVSLALLVVAIGLLWRTMGASGMPARPAPLPECNDGAADQPLAFMSPASPSAPISHALDFWALGLGLTAGVRPCSRRSGRRWWCWTQSPPGCCCWASAAQGWCWQRPSWCVTSSPTATPSSCSGSRASRSRCPCRRHSSALCWDRSASFGLTEPRIHPGPSPNDAT